MRGLLSNTRKLSRFLAGLAGVALTLNGVAAQDENVDSLTFSVIKTAESSGSLEAMVVDGGGLFDVRHLVHTSVLVRHPKGDFLWDSGIGTEAEQQMSAFSFLESQLFSIQNVAPVQQQLTEQNYKPDSLMAIIPSHMHWDHASGLEDFSGVPVWTLQKSYDEAMKGLPPGFLRSQYDSPDINWQIIKLKDQDYLEFEQSFDIYGDGSAMLVDLSGHTHGQLGLFLTLENGMRYFFIGDTTWIVEGVDNNKSRPAIVEWLVGVDTDFDKNARVIDKIHQLSKQYPAMVIVPAHDERQLQRLAVYPEFMK